MIKESQIMHENSPFWVLDTLKTGQYYVMQDQLTHSVRVGTVHYSNDPELALKRAINECNKRALND